jgi:hypothetical protein
VPFFGVGYVAGAGSVIGFSMDGFDMLILSFMLPAISADLAAKADKRAKGFACYVDDAWGSRPTPLWLSE